MTTALTLTNTDFLNWLKGALAVLFAKEGLIDFVGHEIADFQKFLLQTLYTQKGIPPGTTCSSCTTANVLACPTAGFCSRGKTCSAHDSNVPDKKPNQACPNGLCSHIRDVIKNEYRYNLPAWKNSDARRWCSDAFELSKCFMPPDGYSDKTCLEDTDFNGILAVVINNKRFQKKLSVNLSSKHNICEKARIIVREIRHSAAHLLSDKDLQACIDVLVSLLSDPAYLAADVKANDAVCKLKQLKTNTLTMHANDITDVLNNNIKTTFDDQQKPFLHEIQEHFKNHRTDSVEAIYRMIEESVDKQLAELKEPLGLVEDLITYYRENESMIPAAPLVDKDHIPIEELYVQPPMWAYDKPLNSKLGKNTHKGEQTTVSQLFLSDKKVRYRKIYITADAGFGKTSLSQKLTMTWCQAHSPLSSLTKKYEDEELDAMKYFDLLFLLHLADYQIYPLCNLDDLIMQMLSNNMPRNSLYTINFLQRLLDEKRCIIILDGLDGWAHPDKCRRTPAVPHNNHPDRCTVLITSRPWKLGTIGLSKHDIDRHIEISELDWRKRQQLEENAIRILNEENLNRAEKDIADFDEAVKLVEIGDILYNPNILLQLMSLFFGGLPIGKSKCEIYSNITEFTLERGLKKTNLPDILSNDNAYVPNCMNKNEKCKSYFVLLKKLGKLAFYTLFSEKRESSRKFDRKIVTQYLTLQEIEFCLKVGLLCQIKDSSIIAVKSYQVFFQYKSIQEFFSAIYITSEWKSESVKATIFDMCSSISSTLEMENVFVFICGMNPEVYTCLSGDLQKIGDLDTISRRCRFDINSDVYSKTVISYQSMQMQCLQESMRNGNESCPIDLYVVFDKYLSLDLTALKTIIHFNKGHVKSLLQLTEPNEKITEFFQFIDPGTFNSLETLRVEDWIKEPVWLADILTESACSLKCLQLSPRDHADSSLSDISITALTGLTCLQSLYLADVYMTHSSLKCFYAYINQITTLTQLKLVGIRCSDHWGQSCYCDVTLDLHHLNELEELHLVVPYRDLLTLKNEGRTVQAQHQQTMDLYEPGKWVSSIHASDRLWIKCLAQNNMSYGYKAILNKQLPSQNILDDIVSRFGKKSKMVKEICDLICLDIKSTSEIIVDVWPSTKIDDSKITFVVTVNETDNNDKEVILKQIKLTNYSFVKRRLNNVSDEGKEVMYSREFDENLSQTSAEEFERIRKCINVINSDMMKKHKYLTMISSSPFRSKGYGTQSHILEREPCIVLYVLVKGYIPIQEDPFDRSYFGVPVDVREGFVTLFTEFADSYHTSLKNGCQISKSGKNGTLGGFVDYPGFGICGLTCAHVLLESEEMKALSQSNGVMNWHFPTSDQYVYQPNNDLIEQSREQRDHKAGKLVKAIYREGGNGNSGMDIAIFQVESRYPVTGCFPSLRDGLPSNMCFETGETAGYSRLGFGTVTKFGASTDITDGTVLMDAPYLSIRSTYYNVEVFKDLKITLHNLLEVKSLSLSPTREVLPFAMPGDSGALVFSKNKDDKLVCVGVLEGGTSNGTCFVMPISPILEELKLSSLKNFETDRKFNHIEGQFNHIEGQLTSLRNDINHVTGRFDDFCSKDFPNFQTSIDQNIQQRLDRFTNLQTSTDTKVQQIVDNQQRIEMFDKKLDMLFKTISERLPAPATPATQDNQNNNQ